MYVSITNYESVSVDSVIKHSKHMRCIIFSSVVFLSVPYFLTYLIRCQILTKNFLNICFDFLCYFAWHISHSRKN